MEGTKMKTYLIISALSLLILAGCSTTKTTADYDDVYSGSKSIKEEPTNNMAGNNTVSPDYSEQNNPADYYVEDFETGENAAFKDEPYLTTTETTTSPEGTSNITNNYYDGYGYDDYYDYSYASRINRFYSPYMGYNYYAPYYTGFYYDPWYYDSWYGPYFSFGYNWGYGSMYWGYPYYSYYYPYNSYWYGYNNGFWDGYYYGNYGNDYYGSNNYYYGHRPTRSGSNGPNSNVSRTEQQNNLATLHPNYFERTKPELSGDFSKGSRSSEKDVEIPGRISSNSINNNPGGAISEPDVVNTKVNEQPVSNSANRQSEIKGNSSENNSQRSIVISDEKKIPQNDISNPKQKEQGSNQRYTYKKPESSTQSKSDYKPGETIKISDQRPTQKYSKPSGHSSSDNTGRSQQGSTTGSKNTQTYSRPQSTQNDSYSRPAKYNTDNSRNNQPSRQSSDSYSKPAPSENKSYSQPSRSSGTYNQPSRSNSSKSYSAPSNSGSSKSYSSPSRSSNSGSSSSPSRSSSGSSGSSRGGRK
jgi:hypothetical protein